LRTDALDHSIGPRDSLDDALVVVELAGNDRQPGIFSLELLRVAGVGHDLVSLVEALRTRSWPTRPVAPKTVILIFSPRTDIKP
jgi:hypothetical protein